MVVHITDGLDTPLGIDLGTGIPTLIGGGIMIVTKVWVTQ